MSKHVVIRGEHYEGSAYEVPDDMAAAITRIMHQFAILAEENDRLQTVVRASPPPAPQHLIVQAGSFSWALMRLKAGYRVCRRGWNEKGLWAALVTAPTEYFHLEAREWPGLKDAQDRFGPWVPSTSDLLADDWEIVVDWPEVQNAANKP